MSKATKVLLQVVFFIPQIFFVTKQNTCIWSWQKPQPDRSKISFNLAWARDWRQVRECHSKVGRNLQCQQTSAFLLPVVLSSMSTETSFAYFFYCFRRSKINISLQRIFVSVNSFFMW